jgi:hypothetical protein
MKARLLISLLVLLVLAVGFGAGMWTERQRPVPPPPATLMAELAVPAKRLTTAAAVMKPIPLQPAVNRAQLASEIERMKPQIEAFRERLELIEADFDAAFGEILRPAQRERFVEAQRQMAEARAKVSPIGLAPPLSTEQILRLQDRPAYSVLNMVVPEMKLDWLTRSLGLDAAQQEQTRALLRERRVKFIALLDETPPPSLMLSGLAVAAQRLAVPTTPAQTTGK